MVPVRPSAEPGLLPGRCRGQVSGSAPVGVLERGRRRQIVAGGVSGQPGGPRRSFHQQRLAVAGGVPGSVHRTAGEPGGQQVHQLARQLGRGGGARACPEPKQHRQAERSGDERQADQDPGDDPPVPAGGLLAAPRRSVLGPERVVDLAAHRLNRGAVDRHHDRRVIFQQPGHDQPGRDQADSADVPHRPGEEPARGAEGDLRGHPRSGQHAGDAAPPGLHDQPGGQHGEQGDGAPAPEHRTEGLQQRRPRRGQGWRLPTTTPARLARLARRVTARASGDGTGIMADMPDSPGQKTRTVATRRIRDHVKRGWPHLGRSGRRPGVPPRRSSAMPRS
jgi:hypothetical protein